MNAKTSSSSNVRFKFASPVLWALALAAFLLFFRLGERPLRSPDEGRYAEIAREMVASGDWVRPTVFGVGYLRKPPLIYWLTAVSFRVFGENEWSARVIPAFFGWLSILLVYWFGRRFFDSGRALYATLILGTNLWAVQVSRYLLIDPVYSFFLTAAVFFFYAGAQTGKKNVFPFLFFGSLGFAFLAKGPSALVIAGVPAILYVVQKKRWNIFSDVSWWAGLGLFFLIALPWFILMSRREPGFFNFFFLHENVQRFTATDFEHQEPWYYYLVMLPLLLMPWSLYPRTWFGDRTHDTRRFLWQAVYVIVVFFSLSRSKLATYLLPCFPLLAVLAADPWKRWTESKPEDRLTDLAPALLLCFVGLGLIIGAPVFMKAQAGKYPEALSGDLQLLGGAILAGGVFAARSLKRGRLRYFFFSLVFLMAAVSLGVSRLTETVNPAYSNKAFAEKLRSDPKMDGEVFVFDHPGPFYDFAFYLKRPVKLVGLEGELEHFRQDARAGEVSVSREEFFSRIREKKPLVVLMRRSDYTEMDPALRAELQILKQDRRKVLARSGPVVSP